MVRIETLLLYAKIVNKKCFESPQTPLLQLTFSLRPLTLQKSKEIVVPKNVCRDYALSVRECFRWRNVSNSVSSPFGTTFSFKNLLLLTLSLFNLILPSFSEGLVLIDTHTFSCSKGSSSVPFLHNSYSSLVFQMSWKLSSIVQQQAEDASSEGNRNFSSFGHHLHITFAWPHHEPLKESVAQFYSLLWDVIKESDRLKQLSLSFAGVRFVCKKSCDPSLLPASLFHHRIRNSLLPFEGLFIHSQTAGQEPFSLNY